MTDDDGFCDVELCAEPGHIAGKDLKGILLMGSVALAVSAQIDGERAMGLLEIAYLCGEGGVISRPAMHKH